MTCFRTLTAGACLMLAGCIGIDMDIEVLDDESARLTGSMQMQRAMYEMSGDDGEFCDEADGGRLELTDAYAFCHIDQTGSFAELFDPEDDEAIPATMEALGNGIVRVTIPLDDLDDDMDEMIEDPAMVAMFRPMLAGYEISFSITGAEIISTNGEISDDGRTARFSMPLTAILEPDFDIPEAFVTEVRH